jgi:hypothetical protein
VDYCTVLELIADFLKSFLVCTVFFRLTVAHIFYFGIASGGFARERQVHDAVFLPPARPAIWIFRRRGLAALSGSHSQLSHSYATIEKITPGFAMSTIRLPDDLKARVASAAKLQRDFNDVADSRYANIVATGKTIAWPLMRSYLESRIAGKTGMVRPVGKRLAR